ncbi:MAG: glycosyltransferase family 4 protein [Bacteroidales bacterium]|jgi:glycosyltransferase involved in cell wall biosynthesis|nr:glycosyltransferase family 4 protein [Bacteroidales bacterium]MDD4213739.1 glycosyltransferase family 4 protein [Bacteroidales bacterium]
MKKVLFITYYWPPAGGAPINRILKFYQYLHDFGWEPIILTTENGDFPFEDESLQKEVRSNTKIYRSKGLSLHKIFSSVSPKSKKNFLPYGFTDASKSTRMDKLSRWVKYNFIPDTRFPWYFSTVSKAVKIIYEEKIDLIFSSSPPQTNHIIARKAAAKTGLPWVADFRDPWTDVFWLLNNSIRWKWIHNIDKKIEKKTIDKMDAIITVGPSLVQILNRKTTKKIHLISNGFDDTYFSELTYEANTKFRITYAGSLSKEQDPQCFFDTLEILKLNKEFFDNTELEFLGNFPIYLHDIVDASPYKNHTHFSPYTFYTDSLKSIAASELLLLIIPKTDDNKCIITSKLFDYMGAQRPVLAFGPVDGDAASILRETGAGQIFDYSDIKNASEFILSEFNNWKNKTNSYQADKNKIKQFTRKNLTKKLAEIFDSLVKK